MSDLNTYIDTAGQFTGAGAAKPVIVDQADFAAQALEWAARQAERPTPAEPVQLIPVVPMAN